MARRRRHRARRNDPGRKRRRRHNPPRMHRRRRHRNYARRHYGRRRRNAPRMFGGGGRGIVGQVMTGVVDAGWVLAGEAGTNVVLGFVPVDKTGVVGSLVKVGAALAVAWAAKRVSPNAGKMALAGGLASVIRGPVKAANIPFLSTNLGDPGDEFYKPGPLAVGAYPMGSYPMLPAGAVGDVRDLTDDPAYAAY
jgi:hypothetical protein